MQPCWHYLLFGCLLVQCLLCLAELNGFDDNILFRMNWPGTELSDVASMIKDNSILMTTVDNEKYRCILPQVSSSTSDEDKSYDGPDALELLQPLFDHLSCSYRLEQYWTYELCHGRYLKQYHEEREVGKKTFLQQYFLGNFDTARYKKAVAEEKIQKAAGNPPLKKKIATKKIDGQTLPYLEMIMDNGTFCDLSKKPRSTKIMYICYPDSKHEIYSLDEISICEYEVVVLTPLLCNHPDFRLKEVVQNDIYCHPMKGAPKRPLNLDKIEEENKDFTIKKKSKKSTLARSAPVKPTDSELDDIKNLPKQNNPSLLQDFLSGEYCLNGGSGWWKHEFCYGRKVDQYHQESDGSKTVISLGKWNEEKHIQWLEQNPHKRPKKGPNQRQVSHFYSDGSSCDLTGKNRNVEVKYKCNDSVIPPTAISLYLLEPKPCEYILVVESPMLCSLLKTADENGLFQMKLVF